MIKKFAVVIIACLLLLCSCSSEGYTNREEIGLNYNNINLVYYSNDGKSQLVYKF